MIDSLQNKRGFGFARRRMMGSLTGWSSVEVLLPVSRSLESLGGRDVTLHCYYRWHMSLLLFPNLPSLYELFQRCVFNESQTSTLQPPSTTGPSHHLQLWPLCCFSGAGFGEPSLQFRVKPQPGFSELLSLCFSVKGLTLLRLRLWLLLERLLKDSGSEAIGTTNMRRNWQETGSNLSRGWLTKG